MTRRDHEERTRGRLEEARRWFRAHHAGVGPDPGFAGRVAARLEQHRAGDLGHAALRLLPVTLAVVLVLAWLAAGTAQEASSAAAASAGDDVIGWVCGEAEATP